jgi:hypothetical protein
MGTKLAGTSGQSCKMRRSLQKWRVIIDGGKYIVVSINSCHQVKSMLAENNSNRSKRLFCCYDEASGQYILLPRKEKWYSVEQLPYCANCGKLKGSKVNDCYYPERPCLNCGSLKTTLIDYNGYKIDWDKWVVLQNEAERAKMARLQREEHSE